MVRLGGEEFIVVKAYLGPIPDTRARLHEHIAELNLVHSDTPAQRVTASIRLACFTRQLDTSKPQFNLLGAADAALYRAKEGGRNRVCQHSLN